MREYKRDANHQSLCGYARQLGVQVYDCPWAGRYSPGWPDAMWVIAGVIVMVEIKTEAGEMERCSVGRWRLCGQRPMCGA